MQKETQHGILRNTRKLWFSILDWWQPSENWFFYCVSIVLWLSHHENFKPLAFSRTELWPFPHETSILTYLRKLTTVTVPEVGLLWNWCQREAHNALLVWFQLHAKLFAGTGYKRALKFCFVFLHTNTREDSLNKVTRTPASYWYERLMLVKLARLFC